MWLALRSAKPIKVEFLNHIRYIPNSDYPIILTRLGGNRFMNLEKNPKMEMWGIQLVVHSVSELLVLFQNINNCLNYFEVIILINELTQFIVIPYFNIL